jgi:hypothetical protein
MAWPKPKVRIEAPKTGPERTPTPTPPHPPSRALAFAADAWAATAPATPGVRRQPHMAQGRGDGGECGVAAPSPHRTPLHPTVFLPLRRSS